MSNTMYNISSGHIAGDGGEETRYKGGEGCWWPASSGAGTGSLDLEILSNILLVPTDHAEHSDKRYFLKLWSFSKVHVCTEKLEV